MGPKARGEAGGTIRSHSMQGLASTIEFEPCFVSNGKGHSRVFSNTTVQKHQFLGAQLSL